MEARHCPYCGQERTGEQPYCAQCGRAFPQLVAATDAPAIDRFTRRDRVLISVAAVLVLTIAGLAWIGLGSDSPSVGDRVPSDSADSENDLDPCTALAHLEAVRDDALIVAAMGQDGTFDDAERRRIRQVAGRMLDEVGGNLGPQLLEMQSEVSGRMIAAMRQSVAFYGEGAAAMLEAMGESDEFYDGMATIAALETWHGGGERLIEALSIRDELDASGQLDC